jgi:hypothetical protein
MRCFNVAPFRLSYRYAAPKFVAPHHPGSHGTARVPEPFRFGTGNQALANRFIVSLFPVFWWRVLAHLPNKRGRQVAAPTERARQSDDSSGRASQDATNRGRHSGNAEG